MIFLFNLFFDFLNNHTFYPKQYAKKHKRYIKFCEYLGSEQYVYVDCGINNKLIIVKTDPSFKVVLNEKIGLKFISKFVHFFSKDGLRLI